MTRQNTITRGMREAVMQRAQPFGFELSLEEDDDQGELWTPRTRDDEVIFECKFPNQLLSFLYGLKVGLHRGMQFVTPDQDTGVSPFDTVMQQARERYPDANPSTAMLARDFDDLVKTETAVVAKCLYHERKDLENGSD